MGKQKAAGPTEYRVVADGINWPDPTAPEPEDPRTYGKRDHRAERGDMVRLAPELAQGFLDAGHIEVLDEKPAEATPPTAEKEG